MAAGEGTGRAGRPPLIGNSVPLIAQHLVLRWQIPTLYMNTRQRDASANTPPQCSRGLDVVLACVEKGAILVEYVVLVACVSSRVCVATCTHENVLLPASC
jgi:hypothetical protein